MDLQTNASSNFLSPHSPVLKSLNLPRCGSSEVDPKSLQSLQKAGSMCPYLRLKTACITSARSLATGAAAVGTSGAKEEGAEMLVVALCSPAREC